MPPFVTDGECGLAGQVQVTCRGGAAHLGRGLRRVSLRRRVEMAVGIAAFVLAHVSVGAQSQVPVDAASSGGLVYRSPLERELADEVMCTCGGCNLPAGSCGMMNCEGKAAQLTKVKRLVSQGMGRDEILKAFVRDAGGQHILARPLDDGYHRLLWLVPYAFATLSAFALAWTTRRWAATKSTDATRDRNAGIDDAISARLDDELHDLD